jgi:hypothetical protein
MLYRQYSPVSPLFPYLQRRARQLRAHCPYPVAYLPCCARSFKHTQFPSVSPQILKDARIVSRSALRCDSGTALGSARRYCSGTALLHYFCGLPGGGAGSATTKSPSKNNSNLLQLAQHQDRHGVVVVA